MCTYLFLPWLIELVLFFAIVNRWPSLPDAKAKKMLHYNGALFISIPTEIQLVKLYKRICFVHLTILIANDCTDTTTLFIQIFRVNTNIGRECVKIVA